MGKAKNYKVEWVPVGELTPWERNPRINDVAVAAVVDSIKEFGFTNPILVDKAGRICAGHTRYKAAQSLGLDVVPVIRLNLTEAQFKAYNIADNKLSEIAQWDNPTLTALLQELRDEDFNIDVIGYSDSEFNSLLAELSKDVESAYSEDALEDAPPVPKKSNIKPGDLFFLGKHRLLCGDATKEKNFIRLESLQVSP